MKAVVMAGGRGVRLRPYTQILPKPMLPLGERPMLAWLLDGLAAAGVTDVTLAVHYLDYVFTAFFGNGEDWGLGIHYKRESEPLGTAGALRSFQSEPEALIVTNADIVTNLDFADMVRFHREMGAWLTVATQTRTSTSPMGVLETRGADVVAYHEKPSRQERISLGMYVIEPQALAYLPADGPSDMPDLINALLKDGKRVVHYESTCFWSDLGTPADYDSVASRWTEVAELLKGSGS